LALGEQDENRTRQSKRHLGDRVIFGGMAARAVRKISMQL
jgi:hypothetical protein